MKKFRVVRKLLKEIDDPKHLGQKLQVTTHEKVAGDLSFVEAKELCKKDRTHSIFPA